MKNKHNSTLLLLFMVVISALHTSRLNGRVGCMDNSWHLKKAYDDKTYHYVYCTCPCEKRYEQSPNRRKCWKCRHYHEPQSIEMVKVSIKMR